MANRVERFTGMYHFLSNFYPCQVRFRGITFRSSEHAYQWAKCARIDEAMSIINAPGPAAAKSLGKRVEMRPGWEHTRLLFMEEILRAKFAPKIIDLHQNTVVPNPLVRRLLLTGDAELIEGNTWNDTFWGQCPIGYGYNHLGRLLMKIRTEVGMVNGR